MTKTEMVAKLHEKGGGALTKAKTKELIDDVFSLVKDSLVTSGEFRLHGFGVFKKKLLAARKGRNPTTGEIINIPEKVSVRFKPAAKLVEGLG